MKIGIANDHSGVEFKNKIKKYLEDKDGELKDYKFYCYNGIPTYITSKTILALFLDLLSNEYIPIIVKLYIVCINCKIMSTE